MTIYCANVCPTEVPPSERHELFLQKLHQCSVVFDFNDASTEMIGKSIKADTLQELLDWITSQRNVITEAVYPEVVLMVRRRLILDSLRDNAHTKLQFTVCIKLV
jgi:hypothetical protein